MTYSKPVNQWRVLNEFLSNVPVDLEALCKELGVILRRAFLSDDISGMLECKNDQYIITVNDNHPFVRQRFTIAHELGHYMLHRSFVGDGVDDDIAYRSTDIGKYHNTCFGRKEEREANNFAVTLLMPEDQINQYRQYLDVKQMAEKFHVSKQTMSIRLGVPYD